jgi:hypothetical protein
VITLVKGALVVSDIRKALLLLFYLLMIGIGCWATYHWLVLGGRGIVLKAGFFLAGLGVYLLWIDFLSPSRQRL